MTEPKALTLLGGQLLLLDQPLPTSRERRPHLAAEPDVARRVGGTVDELAVEPGRGLLPAPAEKVSQLCEGYARFGLNDRQIELIARATPKRHYYLQSARGNRLFELGLGPIALALCGSSDPAAQARIDSMLAEHGRNRFTEVFLRDAGLDWAADLSSAFPGSGLTGVGRHE
jgi:type IV secretion system protein VirB4